MKYFLTFLLAFQAATFSPPAMADFDHSSWNDLLQRHVISLRGGRASEVDYAGVKRDSASLEAYLDSLSRTTRDEFDHWSRSGQLAFLINSYNAWTLELVVRAYPDVTSIKDLGSFFQSPWKKQFIPLLGETRSLDDIEQGLIRSSGRYNDPRIHFAVNCASIGCPALRPEAFVADRLEAQLEDSTRSFLSDRSRNRTENNSLQISSIFKWYREDFDKNWRDTNNLAGFLARYRQALGLSDTNTDRLLAGDIPLTFLAYDWRLNAKSETRP